jgi:glyoxylase-like metal-dependent hydrolase (beta-lactamase superfamily II)
MRRSILLLCFVVCATPVFAHRGTPPDPAPPAKPAPVFKLEKAGDRVYCLFGQGGNVGILVTDEGVLVVDDQYENIAPGIVEQIKSVTDRPVRYLINTHYHSDHTGGNPVFIKFAEIVAHDNVRPRLLDYPATVLKTFPGKVKAMEQEIAGIPDAADPWRVSLEKDVALAKFFLEDAAKFKVETAAPPGITYQGRVTIWLGGQEIQIFHVAPGHTDGDSMVYFPDQKVLHMGDLLFNGMVPFIDAEGGGSMKGYIENMDYAIAHVPPETRVIAGHGPMATMSEVKRARDFLADLWSEVDKAVKAGMSKADAVRAIRMDGYPDIKPLFRTLGNDIAVAYDEIKGAGR